MLDTNVARIHIRLQVGKSATYFDISSIGVFNLITGSYSWLPVHFTISDDILNWEH